MITTLSPHAARILSESGWHPGRKIDIAPIVDALQSRGFEVYPCVREFLQSFSGLRIPITLPDRTDYLIIDPHLSMTLFEDLPIHPLRTKYETEHNAQSCIIGYSDVDMCDVFSMDSAGYVYGTHLYGNFVLYGKSGHHFIENYLRYGSADFFWRTIAPYNEFRLIEIFSRNPTIASVISYKQTLFGPGLPSRSNTRYEIDQRLREAGFTVHTVNAEPEHAALTLGFPIYSRLEFVPKPVHLIMYNSSSIASDIIAAALKLGIPTIIPTFSGHDLNAIGQCELLGLEFIECSIEHALQRLNTITGQCATYGH